MAGLPDVNLEVRVIQSDCDVTANCGKSIFIPLNAFIKPNFQLVALFVKMFCSVHDTKKKKNVGCRDSQVRSFESRWLLSALIK